MKKINIGVIFLVAIVIIGALFYLQDDKTVAKEIEMVQESIVDDNDNKPEVFSAITESEFNKYLKDKAVVIDIRTPLEIYQGKISKEALEIDFYDKYFQQEILKLDNTRTYFIYCAHAQRTEKAKEIMQSIGFNFVYDLKGGVVTWEGALVK